MERAYLTDTNVIIDFLADRLPLEGKAKVAKVINARPVISVITEIELLSFVVPDTDAVLLQSFVDTSLVLALSPEIVKQTVRIRKEKKMKLPDAILAATAIHFDLVLLTRNQKDFRGVAGLLLEDPWK